MRFDFAIGNPPYQLDRQGESYTALPVYHDFMDAAYGVANVVELITPARFLFDAGRTPKAWNNKMLNDKHLKVLKYEQDASTVFANTEIKGGVAITYRDNSKDFGAIGTFTIYEELNSLLKKILPYAQSGKTLADIAFVASKFNAEKLFADYPEYAGHERRMSSNVLSFKCFHDRKLKDCIMIYGVDKGKRTRKYISLSYVDMTDQNIPLYKIVTPKADGSGIFGDALTNPEVLPPNSGFTHTFLGIGGFATEFEAKACLKYIKSRFARALLGILKITQDLNADKLRYIPLQDFTAASDINWSATIGEIDKQLYSKYGLSGEEIAFIESHVKEME